MRFLDTGAIHRDDARVVALHEILIRAYPHKVEAPAIAGSVARFRMDC